MSPLRTVSLLLPLLLLVLAGLTAAQQQFSGRCPRLPSVRRFQVERYLGHWFEYSRYCTVFQRGLRCSRAQYSDGGSGRIGVTNRAVSVSTGRRVTARGQAVLVGTPGQASLRVSFDRMPDRGTRANYNVVETDYSRYAIVWSCRNLKTSGAKLRRPMNAQFLFVLTRARVPGRKLVRHIMRRLRKLGLNTEKLRKTDQRCPNVKKPWLKKSKKEAVPKLCSFKHG